MYFYYVHELESVLCLSTSFLRSNPLHKDNILGILQAFEKKS